MICSRSLSRQAFFRTLRLHCGWLGCIVLLLLCTPPARADNADLIKQSQTIQIAASDLLTEMYLTEHSLLFPRNDLVVIMFSQMQGARVFLHEAEFYINDELIETYKYPMHTLELLAHYRAVQPMFSTLLPAGEHALRVRIKGLMFGGNGAIDAEKIIHKADKPLFLQLDNGFREIEITEW